ncbi:ABC transporter permease [Kineococcus glutinatus]|uniref:ABC transporter permease n=1 Tax=Kineococcus glutinatus TaxID=1070872 RepID=UPI0031E86301
MSPAEVGPLAVALLLLVAVAVVAGRAGGLGQERAVVVAVARAVVQVLVVGVVIGVVLATPVLAPAYLALALAVASGTSARQLGGLRSAWGVTGLAIGVGAAAAALPVLLTGALERDARDVVPFGAQLVGGAMTATTLAGRRLLDDARQQWDVVEGWYALGATPRQATAQLARTAAARSVGPALDQTRNVGLVVLPGAFVGLLLGGASPLEAARVQLLVLAGLLAAETVAAVVVTRLLARALVLRPVEA